MKFLLLLMCVTCPSLYAATATIRPSSVGSNDQWTCGGCNKVTQVTDLDDCEFGGTAVSSSTVGHKQRFVMAAPSPALPDGSVVTQVTAQVTYCRAGSLNGSWRINTIVGSASNSSSSISSTTNCCNQTDQSLTEPNDGSWSVADVSDLQLELENLSTNGTSASDVVVVVSYSPPAGNSRRRLVLPSR